jgi:PAS domain S-box-containing protein
VANHTNVGQPLVQASLLGEAIDGGPVAVFVADEDMRFLALNDYAAELLGYGRDELLELTVGEVAPGLDAAGRFEELVRTGARLEGETTLRAKDGSDVRFERRAQATSIAGLMVFVWVGWPLDDAG